MHLFHCSHTHFNIPGDPLRHRADLHTTLLRTAQNRATGKNGGKLTYRFGVNTTDKRALMRHKNNRYQGDTETHIVGINL